VSASGVAAGQPVGSTLRELLGHRPWRRWILASFLARLPMAMAPLALVVVGTAVDGSLTLGARLTGVATLCAGLCAPLRGRLLDRHELRGVLQRNNLVLVAAFTLLLVALELDWPVWTLYVLCLLNGWANAGTWSGLRAMLTVVVPAAQLRRSHMTESLVTEVTFVVGPLLAGVLAVLGDARLCLAAMAVVAGLAAVGLRSVGTIRPVPTPRTHPMRRPDLAGIAGLTFLLTLGFALVEANIPQRMDQYHLPTSAGGWYLAVFAVGSCLGGLAISIRPSPRRPARLTAALLLLAFAVLVVPSALAPGAVAYGFALVIAPLAFVPLNGIAAAEFEARLGGTSQRAEAFSYLTAAMIAGGAVGFLANGILLGPLDAATMPLIASALFAVLAAVMTRSHLRHVRRPSSTRRQP
jgi:MFS family permease